MLQMALNILEPRDDTVTLEVYMHSVNMPPFCLAVGLPRCVKTLQSRHVDLEKIAKPLNVASRTDIKDWPGDFLSVVTDSAAVFQALFCRPMLDLAFGNHVCPLARPRPSCSTMQDG
jgi:hypothetical protein